MSWPAGMPLIPVTQDTYLMPDGSLPTTYVVHLTLSVPALVLDGVSTVIRRTIVLDGTGGVIADEVPHLNHPSLSPTPVYYTVREYANGALVRQPWQLTPAANATTLDLDALAPIAGDPGTPVAVGPRGASTLAGLDDVDTTGLADGFTLIWDATSETWQVGAGGAGVAALADLTDVDLTDLADGDALVWDATAGTWVRVPLSSTYAPLAHKTSHATGGADALTPSDSGAAPASGQLAMHTLTAAASVTLSADYPAQALTMTTDTTLAAPTVTDSIAIVFLLSGAFTPTWWAGIKWAGGVAPTYASAATLCHLLKLGASWYGSGQAYS